VGEMDFISLKGDAFKLERN